MWIMNEELSSNERWTSTWMNSTQWHSIKRKWLRGFVVVVVVGLCWPSRPVGLWIKPRSCIVFVRRHSHFGWEAPCNVFFFWAKYLAAYKYGPTLSSSLSSSLPLSRTYITLFAEINSFNLLARILFNHPMLLYMHSQSHILFVDRLGILSSHKVCTATQTHTNIGNAVPGPKQESRIHDQLEHWIWSRD